MSTVQVDTGQRKMKKAQINDFKERDLARVYTEVQSTLAGVSKEIFLDEQYIYYIPIAGMRKNKLAFVIRFCDKTDTLTSYHNTQISSKILQ